MDTKQLDAFQDELRTALTATAKKHGMSARWGRGTYDKAGTATLKIELGDLDSDGSAITKEGLAFKECARYDNIDPGALGKTFTIGKHLYKVSGFNTRARKAPYEATRADNERTYRIPAATLAKHFPLKSDTE